MKMSSVKQCMMLEGGWMVDGSKWLHNKTEMKMHDNCWLHFEVSFDNSDEGVANDEETVMMPKM